MNICCFTDHAHKSRSTHCLNHATAYTYLYIQYTYRYRSLLQNHSCLRWFLVFFPCLEFHPTKNTIWHTVYLPSAFVSFLSSEFLLRGSPWQLSLSFFSKESAAWAALVCDTKRPSRFRTRKTSEAFSSESLSTSWAPAGVVWPGMLIERWWDQFRKPFLFMAMAQILGTWTWKHGRPCIRVLQELLFLLRLCIFAPGPEANTQRPLVMAGLFWRRGGSQITRALWFALQSNQLWLFR